MSRTIVCLALALAFSSVGTVSIASACGGYGEVSEEDRAAEPVWRLLAKHELSQHVRSLDVTLDGDRGRATIQLDGDEDEPLIVFVAKQKGAWRIAS